MNPGPNAENVDPLAPVTVTANAGTLLNVQMVNDAGKPVEGVTTPTTRCGNPTVPLGYGRTYTVSATGLGTDQVTRALVSTFSTLVPGNQTAVRLTTTGNHDLVEGGPTASEPSSSRDSMSHPRPRRRPARPARDHQPPVEGAWTWVMTRPRVAAPALLRPGHHRHGRGQHLRRPRRSGLYGQADTGVTFRIGDAHISVANDITKQVSVFSNGKLVRTMPTSMGMGGSETIGGRTIASGPNPGSTP